VRRVSAIKLRLEKRINSRKDTFNTNFRRIVRITRIFLEINLRIVICLYEVKTRSKEIRVIRTIRLKFVLNGVKMCFQTLIRIIY
jgi:hypothetical protein